MLHVTCYKISLCILLKLTSFHIIGKNLPLFNKCTFTSAKSHK